MASYEIVAFYKDKELEVSTQASRISTLFELEIRYEKLPEKSAAVGALLAERTVLCLINQEILPFGRLMKYVYHLNKPVLLFRPGYSLEVYNNLKLPVGYLSENKEKVVWANFFQRQNKNSSIELMIPKEKDQEIAHMIYNNVSFIRNIFDKSEARYTETIFEESFEKMLQHIFKNTDDAVIFMMLPFRIFSFYLPQNLRILRKYGHAPTLIIPRAEALYIIPCN